MSKHKPKKFKTPLTKGVLEYLRCFREEVKGDDYIAIRNAQKDKKGKVSLFREIVPTLEGLAIFIRRSVNEIESYTKENENFDNAVDAVLLEQARRLITGGLLNKFNQATVKTMLVKHGYINKEEVIDNTVRPELTKKLARDLDKILQLNRMVKAKKSGVLVYKDRRTLSMEDE